MAIFGPKPWVNPFGKMSIFRLFDFLAFRAQKGVFSFQNMVKDIFLAYFEVKKKVPKKDIFAQKPWINPFRKMALFRLFKLLVFIAQKGVFQFQNVLKDIFPPYIAKKNEVGKMASFGPKAWVNPFGKMAIFRLF